MLRVYLVDAMFFIFRSYFAMPKLTNSMGRETGALVGVYNALHRLVKEQSITHMVAVFESSVPTFRCQLDNNYKANRPPAPHGLTEQIPLVIEMCKLLGIKTLNIDNYEADDIMASLAKRFCSEGIESIIVTNDKDLAQVVRYPNVSILRTYAQGKKERVERIGPEEVLSVYGVIPEKIPALLALMGDNADNIPGIKGIGPKTAAKLLNAHSLEELVSDPRAGGRYGELLVSSRERIEKNLKLTEICCDVPFPEELNIDDVRLGVLDLEATREFFAVQQMKQALNSFEGMLPAYPTLADVW